MFVFVWRSTERVPKKPVRVLTRLGKCVVRGREEKENSQDRSLKFLNPVSMYFLFRNLKFLNQRLWLWWGVRDRSQKHKYRFLECVWENVCFLVCKYLEGGHPPPRKMPTKVTSGRSTGPGFGGRLTFHCRSFWSVGFSLIYFLLLPYTWFEVFKSKEKKMKK